MTVLEAVSLMVSVVSLCSTAVYATYRIVRAINAVSTGVALNAAALQDLDKRLARLEAYVTNNRKEPDARQG